jgi:dihydropteroate synthase
MGVLNLTPDSFSDGGQFTDEAAAERQVRRLLAEGADVIDIGAESSKPGALPVPATEQLRRIGRSVERARALGAVVSVDTTSPEVARVVLSRGAELINDVSCLRDPELARATAAAGGTLVLNHSRSPMAEMRGFSEWPDDDYADIVTDVALDWERARAVALTMGLRSNRILFDPGLGFSKNARHCFELLRRLGEFRSLNAPILVGPGRKSFIAAVDPSPPDQRLGGTIAASLLAVMRGAEVVRVHDLAPVKQALAVLRAIDPAEARGAE